MCKWGPEGPILPFISFGYALLKSAAGVLFPSTIINLLFQFASEAKTFRIMFIPPRGSSCPLVTNLDLKKSEHKMGLDYWQHQERTRCPEAIVQFVMKICIIFFNVIIRLWEM